MGLIKQIDDQLGRLFQFMQERGLMDNTMIVFTSDHGDYLGDHWLGEKDLFHEPSARIPFIIYDPDPAADISRGRIDERFVEATDLVPTFIDALGGPDYSHRIDGRSLLPLLRQPTAEVSWRDFAVCEAEYSLRGARKTLDVTPHMARGYMLRTDAWKYILWEGFRPQLFDLKNDPNEFIDLGKDPSYAKIRADMHERVFTWLRQRPIRVTASEDYMVKRGGAEPNQPDNVIIGRW